MKTIMLILFSLSVLMTSCGNINDSDGKIGNEKAETSDTENLKDKASEMIEDATDKASEIIDDVTDKMDMDKPAMFITPEVRRLTTDQAQTVALIDAGLETREVTFSKTYLHNEGGRVYYGVEFEDGDREYEYEIDSVTGAVLSRRER